MSPHLGDSGRTEWNVRECVSDAERSRGDGAQRDRRGLSKAWAAREFRTTPKTVAKWVERFRIEGAAGLRDRSSRPHSSPSQAKPSLRLGGGRGFAKAAPYRRANWRRRASPATVSSMLKRLGLNRLSPLEPAEPVRRYERAAPGEIFHIDIKKLGKFSRIGHRVTGDRTDQSNTRGVGWEICASGDRRPSPSRLLGDPTQRKAQLLTAFPVQRPALLSRPRRQG
jgi:leucine-zipper of insertion element IS481